MYKLVAIDVDGTLINDERKITPNTIEALKRAIEKDVKIVISTARPFYRVKDYLKQLGLIETTTDIRSQYTISFNEAVIVENQTEQALYSVNFDTKEILELIENARKIDTPVWLYSSDAMLIEKELSDEYKKAYKNANVRIVNFKDIDFNKEKIYKIIFVNKPENIIKIKESLSDELLKKYKITSSVTDRIEFSKKEISKSAALDFICKKCNIKPSEVIAIGDADNDLEMIKYVGLGVAMGNATNTLKEEADYITSSNNDDGVGNVIEKFILD